MQLSSECFDFGVDWFRECIGKSVLKEVDYFIGVLVESGGNGVERLEARLGDMVIPTWQIKSCGVFVRLFREDNP